MLFHLPPNLPRRLRLALALAPAVMSALLAIPERGVRAGAAEAPLVVASIGPLHSLAAAVTEGVGAPQLLLSATASPHTYALKPSDVRKLEAAGLVLWIGPDLEGFLVRPLADPRLRPKSWSLTDDAGLVRHPRRKGGMWAESRSDGGHRHAHGAYDAHLWLDPENGRRIARLLARRLAAIDPGNAARYAANADRLDGALATLESELARLLAPVRAVPYVVFHDGYQYFERRFGLNPIGAIVIDPERPPGASRLAALRAELAAGGARCAFAEPQFAPDRVASLVRGTDARAATLDPYGVALPAGPSAYATLLGTLGAALRRCLAG
jgi:zinc transport system substrate-binding protein